MPFPKPLHPLTLVDGMWRGEPCAILGGGPNLTSVDVKRTTKAMHTIAANVAAEFQPTMTYCVDGHVPFLIDKKGWDAGLRLVMCHGTRTSNLRQDFPRQWWHFGGAPGREWSESIAEGIGAAGGCGFYCYNLAYILGASPIYLLGFDCDWESDRDSSHYHNHYKSSPGPLQLFYQVFERAVPHDALTRTWILEPTRLSDLGYQTITADDFNGLINAGE